MFSEELLKIKARGNSEIVSEPVSSRTRRAHLEKPLTATVVCLNLQIRKLRDRAAPEDACDCCDLKLLRSIQKGLNA